MGAIQARRHPRRTTCQDGPVPSDPQQPVTEKVVVGWREWVALPQADVDWVKAKIDTGARSSSIHAFDLEAHDRRRCRSGCASRSTPGSAPTRTTSSSACRCSTAARCAAATAYRAEVRRRDGRTPRRAHHHHRHDAEQPRRDGLPDARSGARRSSAASSSTPRCPTPAGSRSAPYAARTGAGNARQRRLISQCCSFSPLQVSRLALPSIVSRPRPPTSRSLPRLPRDGVVAAVAVDPGSATSGRRSRGGSRRRRCGRTRGVLAAATADRGRAGVEADVVGLLRPEDRQLLRAHAHVVPAAEAAALRSARGRGSRAAPWRGRGRAACRPTGRSSPRPDRRRTRCAARRCRPARAGCRRHRRGRSAAGPCGAAAEGDCRRTRRGRCR